ncbi:hypothetical protein HYX02_06110 [Candidatus Woesearchaeota archaeon]|nr:hypothetical protein [Candidatus Woesearchaeota archaeon]
MGKNKLFIWMLGSGLILSLFMGIIGWVTLKKCTQNIGCFLFIAIPLLPGALLRLEGTTSIIISLIFWFLIGSLIGFLVYKIKKS